MIGIVLVGHGPLPQALLESARMILGDTENIKPLGLMPGDSLEDLISRMHEAVQELNGSGEVLILLDLFGGTPSNAAAFVAEQTKGTCAVSGVNIPMLLETLVARKNTDDVRLLAEIAGSSGKKGIVDVVEALRQFRARKEAASGTGG